MHIMKRNLIIRLNVNFVSRAIKKPAGTFTRPEGMHRELYNLLYSENKELPCPIIPTGINCSMSVL